MLPTLLSPFTALMPVKGTYDVLSVPLLLDRSTVLQLLPPQLRSNDRLLEIPSNVLSDVGLSQQEGSDGRHLVLIQLGRQLGTGPGPMSLNFQEAKIEVPYVSHPDSPDSTRVFSYKQHCVFDSKMLSMGSSVQAGLTSTTTTFSPTDSPSCFEESSQRISYSAQSYVDCEATLAGDKSLPKGAETVKMLSELPWYGVKTPKHTATRFSFEEAPAQTYHAKIRLHLASLSQDAGKEGGESFDCQGFGFRSKSRFTSILLDVRSAS